MPPRDRQQRAKEGLRWVVDLLRAHRVPFAISGGLAAKAYGSPRALNDIDIDIPSRHFDDISDALRPFATFGPAHFADERWDLFLATVDYNGQEIDISGGDEIKICDARTGVWRDMPTDFADVTIMDVLGIMVPVISRSQLVEYKAMLAGEHQQIDIAAITAAS